MLRSVRRATMAKSKAAYCVFFSSWRVATSFAAHRARVFSLPLRKRRKFMTLSGRSSMMVPGIWGKTARN